MAQFAKILACSLLLSPLLSSQSGVAPAWDVKTSMAALAAGVSQLEPVLAEFDADVWIGKGAPSVYRTQIRSSINSVESLVASTQRLAKTPEKLSAALDVLFRMQSAEAILFGLRDAVRKYQSPALADRLNGLLTENANNREALRQYVLELTANKEQEFSIIDQEAQRCRSELARPPRTRGTQ